tara:strand:+ start:282 stop:905 length:624 start_codon:yes stop_codon:yes gene_type:complete
MDFRIPNLLKDSVMTQEVSNTSLTRFNDEFGAPSERAATKVRPFLNSYVKEFIKNSPFAVMSTSGAGGKCDASPKGGMPGFIKILDDTHLLLPDVAGNKLFQSYANLDSNPNVGILFFIPGLDDTVRVNGSASIISKEEMEAQNVSLQLYETDENSKHLQGIVIEVQESYGHCPRAFKFSKFWDVDTISKNRDNRPIPARLDQFSSK